MICSSTQKPPTAPTAGENGNKRKFYKEEYEGAELLLNAITYMLPSVLKIFDINLSDGTLVTTPIAIYIE